MGNSTEKIRMKGTVLIIDDEKQLRGLLKRIIELEDYAVTEVGDLKSAWKILENQVIQVVLSDVKLPDGNGVEFTQKFKEKYPQLEIIVMTAYGTIQDGIKAMKNGAFDYLVKGDDNEKILPMLSLAMDKVQNQPLTVQNTHQGFEKVLGKSKQIKEVISLALKVAKTNTTVLLTGETGTGKEVFANAIHQESIRASKNFVAVNCATFSREILESELFGHKAGSFTGATKDKKGLFEEADGGTIFLDEIGEMSLDLQAKLLRVLETGTFMKVGDTKLIKVDVRIISATNRDLSQEVNEGHFRSDLFYRLSVFQIALPPLRERKTDIEVLARFFTKEFSKKFNIAIADLQQGFLEKLENYDWKGNIRELKNVIERTIILNENGQLTIDSLPIAIQFPSENVASQINSFDLQTIEKQHIQKVLKHTKGNKTETARLLNIGLTTLYRKIEEYGIN
ncbi:DNA-binding NtrC family response regulator [Arcicella sp. BE140]|uniref:sigma-54-dependent transcriptional regulator n=2 Tax=Arcicella TaxID=217140 RepID=UPI00285F8F7F|nr:sigma-54 dependent transcriptional regulator [Arcicella sp. BE140]MDR6562422.1 DNA-binding NtrC family response regulator [Arcicella sp. BE51]MDR6812316.1 DNA-binding NtrC family response regulator [Arcicella sp. BE140]MDR6823647.1 DNA-binding NtrC family response regulator [Arcicella sp. BE139]